MSFWKGKQAKRQKKNLVNTVFLSMQKTALATVGITIRLNIDRNIYWGVVEHYPVNSLLKAFIGDSE